MVILACGYYYGPMTKWVLLVGEGLPKAHLGWLFVMHRFHESIGAR
jgi:hypothetical protein